MVAKKKPSAAQLAARAKFVKMVRAKAAKSKAEKKVAGLDKVTRRGKKTSVYYTRLSGVKKSAQKKSINKRVIMKSSLQIFWTFLVAVKGKFTKLDQIKINKFLGSTGIVEQKMYPFSLNTNGILYTHSIKADALVNQIQGNNPLKKSMVAYKCTDKQFGLASTKKGDIAFGYSNYITLTTLQKQTAKYIN